MDARDDALTVEQAAEAFAAEVAYWREVRGLAKRELARRMGFDPSYVSHVESGRHKPTEDFARRAEEALNAGKAIWKRWLDYETAKAPVAPAAAVPAPAGPSSRTRPARRSSSSTTRPTSTTTGATTGSRCAGCCGTPAVSRSPAT